MGGPLVSPIYLFFVCVCSDTSIQLAEYKHQSHAVTAVNLGGLREVHAVVEVSQIRKLSESVR